MSKHDFVPLHKLSDGKLPIQEITNLFDRDSQPSEKLYFHQPVNICFCIIPITVGTVSCRADQSLFFIEPNILFRNPYNLLNLIDFHIS